MSIRLTKYFLCDPFFDPRNLVAMRISPTMPAIWLPLMTGRRTHWGAFMAFVWPAMGICHWSDVLRIEHGRDRLIWPWPCADLVRRGTNPFHICARNAPWSDVRIWPKNSFQNYWLTEDDMAYWNCSRGWRPDDPDLDNWIRANERGGPHVGARLSGTVNRWETIKWKRRVGQKCGFQTTRRKIYHGPVPGSGSITAARIAETAYSRPAAARNGCCHIGTV